MPLMEFDRLPAGVLVEKKIYPKVKILFSKLTLNLCVITTNMFEAKQKSVTKTFVQYFHRLFNSYVNFFRPYNSFVKSPERYNKFLLFLISKNSIFFLFSVH